MPRLPACTDSVPGLPQEQACFFEEECRGWGAVCVCVCVCIEVGGQQGSTVCVCVCVSETFPVGFGESDGDGIGYSGDAAPGLFQGLQSGFGVRSIGGKKENRVLGTEEAPPHPTTHVHACPASSLEAPFQGRDRPCSPGPGRRAVPGLLCCNPCVECRTEGQRAF